MLTVHGYQTLKQIYESHNSLIYRALRQHDQQPVVLKLLKEGFPSPSELTRYRQEYEITRTLHQSGQLSHVIQAYSVEKYHNTLVIVLEDFCGESLKILANKQSFDFQQYLAMAVEVAKGLVEIHQHHVIHKDINPSNVVFNQDTGIIKIIDFGIATVLKRENTSAQNPTQLEGTLSYISPEQTGRMNRSIDYRTDFYAFGVMLYEWFCGCLPFSSTDSLELIHCHLARHPVSPLKVKPDLPPVLAEIILKLLEKSAEKRYQSATGLLADLENCLQQWQIQQKIESFPLGYHDLSEQFHLPQSLYGREKEVQVLLDSFENICRGNTALLLVAGYSGVGKSFLVNEVYKPLTEKRGYFIGGKFDQYQRNIPYSAFTQAFNEFCTYLLTETAEKLAEWQNKILSAIGQNGQVLIEVIPRLELVLGKQPKVPTVSLQEAQNRFNRVLQQFLRAIGQQQHPLVVFIDDLQWADSASLNLLQLLMTDSSSEYILFIGAYRDNEVNNTHPLTSMVQVLPKEKVRSITLPNLAYDNVNQFIADALLSSPNITAPLTTLVYNKTQGNAFFTNTFLRSLYEEGLLQLDLVQQCWTWDLAKINQKNLTDNVVDLMADKLKRFEEKQQHILMLAACIGNKFNLETLAIINETEAYHALQALWPAISEGFIIPLDNHYKLVQVEYENQLSSIRNESNIAWFRFQHDKVQQAAYSLIDDTKRKPIHLAIARLLLANTPETEQEDRLFDIVNQFNNGFSLITDAEEQVKIAELNLSAGRKAKAAAAYAPALSYFQTGLTLLGEDCWQQHYNLALALTEEAAEAAFLTTDFDLMQQLVEQVLQHAQQALDQVTVYEVLIQAHIAQGHPLEAVQKALTILALLGIVLPEQPKRSYIQYLSWQARFALSGKEIEQLFDLPSMTHPHYLAAMRIMASVNFAAYYVAPDLFIAISLKLFLLSLKYGNSDCAALAYASCGLVFCFVNNDIERGYRLGLLALKILENSENARFRAKTIFIFNIFIRHWKEPLVNSLKPLQQTHHLGLETGDLETAALSAFLYVCHAYCAGQPLPSVAKQGLDYQQAITGLKQEITLHRNAIYCQAVLNLLGETEEPCVLTGEVYSETTMLPKQIQIDNKTVLCRFYSNKLMLCYLFEEYEQAAHYAELTQRYAIAGKALIIIPIALFYDSLTQLALANDVAPHQRRHLLHRVQHNQRQLKYWTLHAPMNFLHKYQLIQAEYYRVIGEEQNARSAYETAISLAHEHEYLQEEALAYELAGRFYLTRNFLPLAQFYLQSARYCYTCWGAQAKVKQLEALYPQFLLAQHHHNIANTQLSVQESDSSERLELGTVLKASQALAEEIVLKHLLEKLMKIVLENAGAQHGFLLLEDQGQWWISAQASVERGNQVLQPVAIASLSAEQAPFALSVVNYVIRTHEPVVLHHAWQEGLFIRDNFITKHKTLSLLCLPLVNQGHLNGVLYLENNLAIGMFTPERLKILTLLSAQMAISINNARLYRSLADSEARLRIMAETIPIAVMITRPKDGLILYANVQAGKLFDLPVPELVGSSMVSFYQNAEDRELLLDAFNQNGIIRDYELSLHTANQKAFLAGTFLAPFQYNNEKVLLSVFYDLTERKRAEEERLLLINERAAKHAALRLNEETTAQKEALSQTLAKLQAAQDQLIESEKMAALGNLVAGVAHEINTPVGIGVTGISQLELLSKELQQSFDKGQMKRSHLTQYLENVAQIHKLLMHNLQRAASLIQSFKKVAVDRTTDQVRHFQLADYLQEIITSLRPEFRRLPHQVRIKCDPSIYMNSYPGLLSQVLTNLILNSLQHGFLAHQAGLIQIEAHLNDEHWLYLTYSDDGQGMSEEVQQQMFEPFFTTNRERGGSGLGLHIVYNHVKHQLGGQIRCETRPQHGTRFIIELPLDIEQTKQSAVSQH